MSQEKISQFIRKAAQEGQMTLDLSFNQLNQVPPEINQLTRITHLSLRDNQISQVPSEIVQLAYLTVLDLSGNQLGQLLPEIGQLANLTRLDLSRNQLSQLPPEIGQLANLTTLNLSGNQLSQLPPEMSQLANLRDNQFRQLLPKISQLANQIEFDFTGNPLTSPPLEIAKRGIEAIRDYFASIEDNSRLLSEVKLLLVGEGKVGKTSLVKRVLGEAFDKDEPTTHGIRIRDWAMTANGKSIKVNIWDFGGQQIMHATHQFFLSKRCIYVLVLDGRRDERPEYWLQHIQSFGGDAPILVALNKYDENPAFQVNSRFLQQKYPNIQGFYPTSCLSGYGLAGFKAALIKALAQVKLMETRWPNSWFKVKQELEALPDHFISYERYEEICAGAAFTGNFVPGGHIDHINPDIHQLRAKGGPQIVPPRLSTNIVGPRAVHRPVRRSITAHQPGPHKFQNQLRWWVWPGYGSYPPCRWPGNFQPLRPASAAQAPPVRLLLKPPGRQRSGLSPPSPHQRLQT